MNNLSSLATLAGKNLKRWRFLHALIGILVVLSFSLHVLFSSSLASTEQNRITNTQFLNLRYTDYIVTHAPNTPSYEEAVEIILRGGYSSARTLQFFRAMIQSVDGAIELSVSSPLGSLDLLGLSKERASYNISQHEIIEGRSFENYAEVLIPASLAKGYDLHLDHTIPISSISQGLRKELNLTIVGVYQDDFDFAPCLLSYDTLSFLNNDVRPNRYLIKVDERANNTSTMELLNYIYPEERILYSSLPLSMATDLVNNVWQDSFQLMIMVYLFSGVALFTIVLIIFLERKRELATFKSVGISNNQILALTSLEFGSVEMIALALGLLAVLGFRYSLAIVQDVDISLFLTICTYACLGSVVVFLIAQAFPTLTTMVASVNHLFFSRTIPLIVRRIDHTDDNADNRQRMMQGNKLLKVPMIEGEPDCLVLREVGGRVKKGEVLAVLEFLGGLYVTQWVAPTDGLITRFETGGYITIQPDTVIASSDLETSVDGHVIQRTKWSFKRKYMMILAVVLIGLLLYLISQQNSDIHNDASLSKEASSNYQSVVVADLTFTASDKSVISGQDLNYNFQQLYPPKGMLPLGMVDDHTGYLMAKSEPQQIWQYDYQQESYISIVDYSESEVQVGKHIAFNESWLIWLELTPYVKTQGNIKEREVRLMALNLANMTSICLDNGSSTLVESFMLPFDHLDLEEHYLVYRYTMFHNGVKETEVRLIDLLDFQKHTLGQASWELNQQVMSCSISDAFIVWDVQAQYMTQDDLLLPFERKAASMMYYIDLSEHPQPKPVNAKLIAGQTKPYASLSHRNSIFALRDVMPMLIWTDPINSNGDGPLVEMGGTHIVNRTIDTSIIIIDPKSDMGVELIREYDYTLVLQEYYRLKASPRAITRSDLFIGQKFLSWQSNINEQLIVYDLMNYSFVELPLFFEDIIAEPLSLKVITKVNGLSQEKDYIYLPRLDYLEVTPIKGLDADYFYFYHWDLDSAYLLRVGS